MLGGRGKSENAVIARLVLVRMPGHTPLCGAVACHWPPRASLASKTVTSKPASSACFAATRPAGPAPMTATRAPAAVSPARHYLTPPPTIEALNSIAKGPYMADGRARVLADGNEIPLLGLGRLAGAGRAGVRERGALGARARLPPHRHGAGVRQRGAASGGRCATAACRARRSSSRRSSIPARKDPEAEAERSLERLGVDYVDLYIIHWPQGGPTWAWDGMQRAQAAGYARSIGVSNFSVARDRRAARGRRRRRRSSTRSSSARSSTAAALLEACEERGDRARGLQPARHRPPPRRRARRADRRAASAARRRRC